MSALRAAHGTRGAAATSSSLESSSDSDTDTTHATAAAAGDGRGGVDVLPTAVELFLPRVPVDVPHTVRAQSGRLGLMLVAQEALGTARQAILPQLSSDYAIVTHLRGRLAWRLLRPPGSSVRVAMVLRCERCAVCVARQHKQPTPMRFVQARARKVCLKKVV